MENQSRTYISIDLKSFYASVECMERGLDPLGVNLVVADASRTEKTICLAVSPSLKAYGIPGRARLFEVVQRVKEVNRERLRKAPGHRFRGKSSFPAELSDPSLEVGFEIAVPRMRKYMEISSKIYSIYLRYIAPEDIHVYSIDEVMMDVTGYLETYGTTARELARSIIREVYRETGITATAGIGTNLYLSKVAMDIVAKHVEADRDGVRIAELDELTYRKLLWRHRPLTDFWRVGRGYAKKLEALGIYTMGDVARCSIDSEETLYRLFGVNAELLIDHAWGWEPCTMDLIKAYRPENSSFSSGQVLHCAYDTEKARVVVHEMADAASLDLVEKRMMTDQVVLTVGYDIDSAAGYKGELQTDFYGRTVPKRAHGTENLGRHTSSSRLIDEAVLRLYDRIINPKLLVRRITLVVNHVVREEEVMNPGPGNKMSGTQRPWIQKPGSEKPGNQRPGSEKPGIRKPGNEKPGIRKPGNERPGIRKQPEYEQLNLFTDYEAIERQKKEEEEKLAKERNLQEAMLSIRNKYGKNAILKGINLKEGATGRDRNRQVGGHKS